MISFWFLCVGLLILKFVQFFFGMILKIFIFV
jgi:hypothetical protein